MSHAEEAITPAHHDEWARVVAALARHFGDLDIAEEAVAEAFTTAVERMLDARTPGVVAGTRSGHRAAGPEERPR